VVARIAIVSGSPAGSFHGSCADKVDIDALLGGTRGISGDAFRRTGSLRLAADEEERVK